MSRLKHACTPDCPNRTVTCKFDGSCGEYTKFRRESENARAETQRRKKNEQSIVGVLIDSCERSLRRANKER